MNATIYLSLFRWRDKLILVGVFVSCVFLAFLASVPTRQGGGQHNISGFFVLLPALGLGGILAEVWNRPLQRPTTSLLPGLQRTLFRWHTGVILAVAFAWGGAIHWVEPRIPLAAAMGMSAGMFTLSLPFLGGPPRSKLFNFGVGMGGFVFGLILPSHMLLSFGNQFLEHAPAFGAAGVALTAVNLWFAQKRKWPATTVPSRSYPLDFGEQLAAFCRHFTQGNSRGSNPRWTYSSRGTSLVRWVRAAFQENPSGFSINVTGCVLVLLIHPWVVQRAAGFPLGWYRLVFAPDQSGGTTGSIISLMVAMIASSLGPVLLRTGQLYPISRERRASIAFAASAAGFALNFFALAGGSLLAGWIVGLHLGLPLPWQPAAEFIVRMAAVVPFMSLMRWSALRLELSQSLVSLLLFVAFVAIMVSVSQSFILDAGLAVGAAVCVAAIIVSQLIYRWCLWDLYVKGDLVRRGSGRRAGEAV